MSPARPGWPCFVENLRSTHLPLFKSSMETVTLLYIYPFHSINLIFKKTPAHQLGGRGLLKMGGAGRGRRGGDLFYPLTHTSPFPTPPTPYLTHPPYLTPPHAQSTLLVPSPFHHPMPFTIHPPHPSSPRASPPTSPPRHPPIATKRKAFALINRKLEQC